MTRLGQLYAALRRARGGPGGLVEDGRGQGRGVPHLPGDRQPAGQPEAAAGASRSPRRCSARTRATGKRSIGTGRPWRRSTSPRTAARRFQALLDLTITDDEKSAFTKAKARNPKLTAPGASSACRPIPGDSAAGGTARQQSFDPHRSASSTPAIVSRRYTWSPADFGQARMAALGWLDEPGRETGTGQERRVRRRVPQRPPRRRRPTSALSGIGFISVRCAQDNAGAFEAAKALSRAAPTDPMALWAYLYRRGRARTSAGPNLLR